MIDARDFAFDWTNSHSSVSAMAALIAQCNTEGKPADFSNCVGTVGLDGFCGVWLNGTGPKGPQVSWSDSASGVYPGVTFDLRKQSGMSAGVGATVPWARFHAGSHCLDINFTQSDQVTARIDIGSNPAAYDASVAAALLDPGNAPDVYPPAIVSDHLLTDTGAATTTSTRAKFSRGRFERLGFSGLYDGMFICHEAGADFNAAVPATAQKQATDIEVDVRGWCLHNDITLGQSGTMSRIRGMFTPIWSPYLLDFHALWWAMENKESFVNRNRCVGLDAWINTRVARRGWVIRGGYVASPAAPYRGIVAGRVNKSQVRIDSEQVPTVVKAEVDGYLHAVDLQIAGLAYNKWRADLVTPAIDIQTDRDKAGSFNHRDPPTFVPLSAVVGTYFTVRLRGGRCTGEWLRVAATDGTTMISVTGEVAGWGLGDPSRLAFHLEDGCLATLRVDSMMLNASVGQGFYRIPTKQQLTVTGATYHVGGINPPIVNLSDVDHADELVFASNTRWLQEGFQANADALDDEEG